MKKLMILLGLLTVLVLPAAAMEYTLDAPDGPDFGKPTSVEPVVTRDGGAQKNENLSKDRAQLAPAFGSSGVTGQILNSQGSGTIGAGQTTTSAGFTEASNSDLYAGGYLGTLQIPRLGLTVQIYPGTDDAALKNGVGHFTETSIWDGNVALAGHNRGVNSYFGEIHLLNSGDTIRLTTKHGTRTYRVTSVSMVSQVDRSGLMPTANNVLTLYTCVRNQSSLRWCVRAELV